MPERGIQAKIHSSYGNYISYQTRPFGRYEFMVRVNLKLQTEMYTDTLYGCRNKCNKII